MYSLLMKTVAGAVIDPARDRKYLGATVLVAAGRPRRVTFKYKQRKTGQWKPCRLTGLEFLRRFLTHVLPKGLHKLRYYGLWHHSKRRLQERARLLLSLLAPVRLAECLLIADVAAEADRLSKGEETSKEGFLPACPHCGSHRVEHLQERCRGYQVEHLQERRRGPTRWP